MPESVQPEAMDPPDSEARVEIHIHNSTIGAVAAGASPHASGSVAGPPSVSSRRMALHVVALMFVFGCVAIAAVVLVALHDGVATVAPTPNVGSPKGIEVAMLARVSMQSSPEGMAALTGAQPIDSLHWSVPLAGGPFTNINFEWDRQNTAHVSGFTLTAPSRIPNHPEVRGKLRDLLGPRFAEPGRSPNPGAILQWSSCELMFSEEANVLSARVSPTYREASNPHWERQIETLWDVVRAAALRLDVRVDADAVRDWLGGGYSLAPLATVDPLLAIEQSGEGIGRLYRGAISRTTTHLEWIVPIRHPSYIEAVLAWDDDKKGATLEGLSIEWSPEKARDQAAVEACMQHALGVPDSRDSDGYGQSTWSTTWRLPSRAGRFWIGRSGIRIDLDVPAAPEPAKLRETWQKVISAIDRCGRP